MSVFRMKDFAIVQGTAAMKVGTDGTLLAAYTASWLLGVGSCIPSKILDVGSGTGVISLMMAQKFPSAHVTGIDIDPGAAETSRRNFEAAPFSDRLLAIEGDFASCELPYLPYDLVISNPPYFDGSTTPPSGQRTLARHDIALSPDKLLTQARRVLTDDGLVALVLPTESLARYIRAAESAGLYLRHRCGVITSKGKTPKRDLILWTTEEGRVTEDSITILENGSYTEQYETLMRDFLTIF